MCTSNFDNLRCTHRSVAAVRQRSKAAKPVFFLRSSLGRSNSRLGSATVTGDPRELCHARSRRQCHAYQGSSTAKTAKQSKAEGRRGDSGGYQGLHYGHRGDACVIWNECRASCAQGAYEGQVRYGVGSQAVDTCRQTRRRVVVRSPVCE